MWITHLLLIGFLISLATVSASKKSEYPNVKSVSKLGISNAKTSLKAANTTTAPITRRSTKSSKINKSGENRGKRNLYDFNSPAFIYPQIAARRAGYNSESGPSFGTQSGYFNGQNAVAQLPTDYNLNYSPYPQYLEAPEPIIEIIIKDANETSPEGVAPQPLVSKTKKKKEKVHVFYVNYKKDQNNKLHLESPIASLNNDETEEEEEDEENVVHYTATPLPPVKSTTLRTIIHPDSEKYHSNSGIHVTFGSEDNHQREHVLEEHDAESVLRQVVAIPVPHTGLKSQFHVNDRNDFQGEGRSPFSSSFFQSTAPWQYQAQKQQQQFQNEQKLPLQRSSTFFNPLPQSSALQQHPPNQSAQLLNQHYPTNPHQKQPFYQQKNSYFASKPQPSGPAQVQQPQRNPSGQINQQLQRQSQYYINHNQLYQQQPAAPHHQLPSYHQQPAQPSQQHLHQQHQSGIVQQNQFYNGPSPKTTQPTKAPIVFPTASEKAQELPARPASQLYHPIKFRPTPAPASQQKNPTPIPVKLENTHFNPKPYIFQKQPQFIKHPTFTMPVPNQHTLKTQIQSENPELQKPQYQQYQTQTPTQHHSQTSQQHQQQPLLPNSNVPQGNTLYHLNYQQKEQQQHHQAPVQQNIKYPTAPAFSHPGLNWRDPTPSKETELLKAIPKFEQHITETVQNQYNPNQYQTQTQVIHDIPAPNLGSQLHQQPPQKEPLHGHYITASAYNSQSPNQQKQQQSFTNFVTATSSLQHSQRFTSTTQAPLFGEGTDGQKIMIVTPMPSNIYQQYQTGHSYQAHQNSANNQQHSTQITNSAQAFQEQYNNYHPQPGQLQHVLNNQAQSTILTNNSPYSVSNYHSDVFKELEQRNSQTKDNPPHTTTTTAPYTTAASSTTINPKTLLQLPDEVPDDLRQQLLSSGILNNADISVLDYDKVGETALENLPAEHLQHFYGAGGGAQISESTKKVLSVVKPNGDKVSLDKNEIDKVKETSSITHRKQADVKIVRYEDQTSQITEKSSALPSSSAERQYNRYLPLKINAANFPTPDVEVLKAKSLQSIVVLAPVETPTAHDTASLEDPKELKFLSGDLIKTLVKKPTTENFKRWIDKEARTDVEQQSVVLLVAKSPNSPAQEIFMYDITTGEVNKLNGELSSKFVSVAEENASTEDLEHGSTLEPNFMEAMIQHSSSS